MFRFYDDELHNLILVADRSYTDIVKYTSSYDFHPPLQYFINKISLNLFGLDDFLISVPSILFSLLSVFLAGLIVYSFTRSKIYSVIITLIMSINPLIILWGASIRWYPIWTFLSMLSLYLILNLIEGKREKFNSLFKSITIVTLTLALYTNYQAIIFLASLFISSLVPILKKRRQHSDIFKTIIIIIIAVFVLFIPYLPEFYFHLQNFYFRKEIYSGYFGLSPVLSIGYFLYSVLVGNSIYPWDAKFIMLFSIIIISAIMVFVYAVKTSLLIKCKMFFFKAITEEKIKPFLYLLRFSVTLFLLFLVLSIFTGTNISRGIFILPIIIVINLAVIFYHLFQFNKKFFTILLLSLIVPFISLWLVSSYNVIEKKHLHKASLMDPVDELISILGNNIDTASNQTVIVTTDPVLTYYILKSSFSYKINLFSPYLDQTKSLMESFSKLGTAPKFDSTSNLIFINTYSGSLLPVQQKIDSIKNYISREGEILSGILKLGFDPDAKYKRRYFPSASITEWRYNVILFQPKSVWSFKELSELLKIKVH